MITFIRQHKHIFSCNMVTIPVTNMLLLFNTKNITELWQSPKHSLVATVFVCVSLHSKCCYF